MARFAVQLMLLLAMSPAVFPEALYGYEDESENLIPNWGFEEDLSPSYWEPRGDVTYTRTTEESHTGLYSLRVSPRSESTDSMSNNIHITEPGYYYYSAFVLAKDNGTLPDGFFIRLYTKSRSSLSELPYLEGSGRWRQLGGDFLVNKRGTRKPTQIRIVVSDPTVEYYIDSVSLIKLHEDPDWKAKAEAKVLQRHTTDINIGITVPDPIDTCTLEFKVRQTKRHFGLGSIVNSWRFFEDSTFGENYRQLFYDNFEWSGFENALKWYSMEQTEGNPAYFRVDGVLSALESRNITMRAHNVMWSMIQNVPVWLRTFTDPAAINAKIDERIDTVMAHYRGRFVQWDVMNEHLRGRWLEQMTGRPRLIDYVYRRVQAIDPDTTLMINEPRCYRFPQQTSAVPNLHLDLVERGVPNTMIGVQGHFKDGVQDPRVLKKRMDIICGAGAPVMVTEMSIHTHNTTERAKQLDEALLIAAAANCTVGILLWGVSDQFHATMRGFDDMSLFEGDNWEPNAAGEVWLRRLSEWKTPDQHLPAELGRREANMNFNGWHGAFELQVLYNGDIVKREPFYVHPGDNGFSHTVTLNPGDFEGLEAAPTPCPAASTQEPENTTTECDYADNEHQMATAARKNQAWQNRSPTNSPL